MSRRSRKHEPARKSEPITGKSSGGGKPARAGGGYAGPSPLSERRPGWPSRVLDRIAWIVDSRLFVWLCLLGMCGLFGWMVMLPVNNPDLGWHVALGRYIVENRSIPRIEPFVYNAIGGLAEPAHEWLTQVVYWLTVQASGVLGLRWAHAALSAVILIVFFLLLRRAGVGPALALLGTFAYLVIAQGRFHPRPHLVNMLFMVGLYGYVFVLQPALSRRQLVGIFVVAVIWANLHSAAISFAAIVVLYVLVEIAQQKIGWRQPQPDDLGGGQVRRLVLLAGLVCVSLVLTPSHFRLFPYILESRRINAPISAEWRSITAYWGNPMMTPFSVETYWIVAAATVIAAVLVFRRASLSRLAVVAFMLSLPLSGQRFVSDCFVPVLFVLCEFSRWASVRHEATALRGRALTHRVASVLAVALVFVAIHPALNHENKFNRYEHRLSADWNFQPGYFPIGAVRFLDEVDLTGRLFNSSDWGGYILLQTYRKYPVFIDGRWVTVGKKVLDDSMVIENRRAGAFEKLDEYKVDILLVYREWMTQELQRDRKWVPVFENLNAGVYVRDTPANAENLRKCAEYYRARGIPFDPAKGFSERAAFVANREWCREFRVERMHLRMRTNKKVAGW